MARLDRLAPVKEVAQLGAVLGREFAYEVLAAVSLKSEPALSEALEQLVGAGLLFRRGQLPEARYRFKHALVQDAAYASPLKSTRQQLHRQIATVLRPAFPPWRRQNPRWSHSITRRRGSPHRPSPTGSVQDSGRSSARPTSRRSAM